MEMQIQDLISSIKKEGIEEAQKKSEQIISEAKVQAEEIVSNAKKDAAAILEKAQRETELLAESAATGARQAQRDAVLAFKKEIQGQYQNIIASEIRKTFDMESLATLIKAAIGNEDVSKYSVELSNVAESLKSELAQEIKNGLEIKVSEKVKYGFRLATKDGDGYFDCTDEEIAQMLKPFFSNLNM